MWDDRTGRIGYVLKMYPRFSETFIVTELLALEEQGVEIDLFSLRAPVDGRFHESISRVRAQVSYVPVAGKAVDVWHGLQVAQEELGSAPARLLPELLAVPPADACQALWVAVEARRRDLSHLHAHFASLPATVARLAARLAGITYSVTLHAKDIFHRDVDDDTLRQKLADAATAVTVSDYNARHLRDRFGAAAHRVTRVYNGIDLQAFAPSVPDDRPPVVAGVGRLVEKKGFRHLVEAVALLRDRGRPVQLELVGAGEEEARLRAQVAAAGLADLVTFHGPLTQGETRDLVRGAAVLAAPCVVGEDGNRDGLPTVVLESLALGTPVVATPVTGMSEAVLPERTGLLVPEGDAVALAEALERLLADAGLRVRLAAAGRRHVERHFDARVNSRRLRELIATRSWSQPVPDDALQPVPAEVTA